MEQTASIKLIIGKKLSKIVIDDDGEFLKNEVKKLREKENIPPVLITDETEIDDVSVQIQVDEKIVQEKTLNLNKNKEALIEDMKTILINAL